MKEKGKNKHRIPFEVNDEDYNELLSLCEKLNVTRTKCLKTCMRMMTILLHDDGLTDILKVLLNSSMNDKIFDSLDTLFTYTNAEMKSAILKIALSGVGINIQDENQDSIIDKEEESK